MLCTHLACFDRETVKVAPALHDESLSLSLSLLFMHHKILLSLVSLKHESESVAPALHDALTIHFHFLLCMMHHHIHFHFHFLVSMMHHYIHFHFHFLFCMMHHPFTFSPLHALQKPPILFFTVVFGLRPIANHHCKTSIIQLEARKEKYDTQKTFHKFPRGFLVQTLTLLFVHICAGFVLHFQNKRDSTKL